MTNQKHYSDRSSLWNFYSYFLDVISWENSGGITKCQLFSQAKGAVKRAIPPTTHRVAIPTLPGLLSDNIKDGGQGKHLLIAQEYACVKG